MNFRDILMTAATAGSSAWWEDGAVLDADFLNGRYYHAATGAYPDETTFLAAIAGTKNGIVRTIGPYVDPSATNLLTNDDFSDGTTGWAASGAGASIANVAGEGELTAAGSDCSLSNAVSMGTSSRAVRVTATSRRGTTSGTLFVAAGTAAALGGAAGSASHSNTTNTVSTFIASREANTMYFGLRNFTGAAGTAYLDNVSAVDVWPIMGFTQGAFAVAITASAPAAAATDEVLFQMDGDNERNRVRVIRQVSDDHVVVIFTATNGLQASLDLGTVADGADFSVALSGATNNFAASLDGGVPVTDTSGTCPGLGVMRIGRSFTGNTWTGGIDRVTVF